MTNSIRRSPLGELVSHIQSNQQIDSKFDAIALHQFDALIQVFAEHWWRVVFEPACQARIARRSFERKRARCCGVHEVTLPRNGPEVDLQLSRCLQHDT